MKPILLLLCALFALASAWPALFSAGEPVKTSVSGDDPHYIRVCLDQNFEGACGVFMADPEQCVTFFQPFLWAVSSIDTRGRTCYFFSEIGCAKDGAPGGHGALTVMGQMPYLDDPVDNKLASFWCTDDGVEKAQVDNTLATRDLGPAQPPTDPHYILLCRDIDFGVSGCGFFLANPYRCLTFDDYFLKEISAVDTNTRTCVFSIYRDCAYDWPGELDDSFTQVQPGQVRISGRGPIGDEYSDQFQSFFCTDEGLDGNPKVKRLEVGSGFVLSGPTL